ncbi:MAG: hypothetical protein ACRC33_24640 [Gemmataceae bacterium]
MSEKKRAGRGRTPRLEALEDRSLLSVTPVDVVDFGMVIECAPPEEVFWEDGGCYDDGGAYIRTLGLTKEDELLGVTGDDTVYATEDLALIDPNLFTCTMLPPDGESFDGEVWDEVPLDNEGWVPGPDDEMVLYAMLPPEATWRMLDGEESGEEPVYEEEWAVGPEVEAIVGELVDPILYTMVPPAEEGGEVAVDELPPDSPLIYQTFVAPPVTAPVAAPAAPESPADAVPVIALPEDAPAAAAPESPKVDIDVAETPRELTDGSTGYRRPVTTFETPA